MIVTKLLNKKKENSLFYIKISKRNFVLLTTASSSNNNSSINRINNRKNLVANYTENRIKLQNLFMCNIYPKVKIILVYAFLYWYVISYVAFPRQNKKNNNQILHIKHNYLLTDDKK